MTTIENMAAPEIASWVSKAGAVLVSKDPAVAAQTFAKLNGDADAALGGKIVGRRLDVAHGRRKEIDELTRRIAARHAITVEAILSDRLEDHIVHAKRHLAHALHHRLGMTPRMVGIVTCCERSTAYRRICDWAKYLKQPDATAARHHATYSTSSQGEGR